MAETLAKDESGATPRMLNMYSYLAPNVPKKDAAAFKQLSDNLPNLCMRDDDVMLCSYPKTGTNWTFEILSMMLQKSAERIKIDKFQTMMEAQTPEYMEMLPSPRVMNCHNNLKFLPGDLKKKQIKTVLIVRNPKDTAVSMYNHMRGINYYDYHAEIEDFIPPYLNGDYESGKYTTYLQGWQEGIEKGVGFPLHVMYYEDLKLNGAAEIDKLEKFLELDLGQDLKQAIIESCHFDKMVKDKRLSNDTLRKQIFNDGFSFYRKGQIGDWKNWFTVQLNEVFEKVWEEETKGLKFSFIYTDPRET